MTGRRTVSVVVPVYNSAQTLPELLDRLQPVLEESASLYEVVLVNDGSADQSGRVMRDLARTRPWVQTIELMRNYGQHNALLCGIRSARYDVIVTIDDDLQHPPEELPRLIAALDAEDGYDLVYGTAQNLRHSGLRNALSRLTKDLLARNIGLGAIRDVSAFRAFRAYLRPAFADVRGPDVILDVLLGWGTTRITAVPVGHQPRKLGKSNYTVRRLIRHGMMMLTGYSTAPLRFASLLGFAFTMFGFLTLVYVVVRVLLVRSVPGFPFLASMISLFSGVQLFVLGIIGEYLARMFNRNIDKPTYVVRSCIGAEKVPDRTDTLLGIPTTDSSVPRSLEPV